MAVIAALLLLAATETTVEQSHKNIKVLQGTPTSQLIPTMAFMANSLGVTCAHCHGEKWESDEKPAKEAARRMIVLQRDINARYYEGKPVVTCNSCHRGDAQTAAVPAVANAGWNRTASLAAAQDVAAEEAVQRLPRAPQGVTRRILRGTVERFNGRSEPVSGPFTLTFDGDQVKYDTALSHPPEATRALAVYTFGPLGAERVRGERWTFDERGALKRRTRETSTPLGTLPEQIDYEDFRQFQGAPTPYLARWSRADYRVTFTIKEIEDQRPNLQVLRSVPESQLFLLMNTIGDSLGVQCDYCHIKEGDKWVWQSDAKPTKAVGRDMMRMTLAMNAASFGGRTAVTCYTCHHGSLRAERVPPLPPHKYSADPPPRALPAAIAVIDRYRNAIGAARDGESPAMTLKGTAERSERAGPFEIVLKGETVHLSAGGATQDLAGDRAKGVIELFRPMKVAGDPAQMRVAGIATIDGHDAYEVVTGNRTYFFDVDSGLLVRRVILTETLLGPMPEQVDFGDYRPVSGVLFPYMIRTSDAAAYDTATRHFSEIVYDSGGDSRQ
jgi:hypothetical protein